jgi:acyl carrier protein
MTQNYEQKVLEILNRFAGESGKVAPIGMDHPLADSGISSVNFLKIVVDLEEAFDIDFDPEDLNARLFETARNLCSYVNKKIAAEHGPEAT